MKRIFEKHAKFFGLYLTISMFALVLLDCLIFWAFDRRPILSSELGWIATWSIFAATAISLTTRFAIQRKQWQRFALAGVVGAMVMTSSMHPWLNGWGVNEPEIKSIERDLPEAIMEFPENTLSEGKPI